MKHHLIAYVKTALFPALLIGFVVGFVSLFVWGGYLADHGVLTGVGEVFTVGGIAWSLTSALIEVGLISLSGFRRHVDNKLLAVEKEQAKKAREAILAQMTINHSCAFKKLEETIDQLRKRLAEFPAVSSLVVEECLDLLGQYARLAIHYKLREITSDVDYKIQHLTYLRELSPVEQQYLEVLKKRQEVIGMSKQILRDMDTRLSTLEHLILLKTEQPLSPPEDMPHVQFRVEDTNIMQELGEFTRPEEAPEVDMQMMQLGRS